MKKIKGFVLFLLSLVIVSIPVFANAQDFGTGLLLGISMQDDCSEKETNELKKENAGLKKRVQELSAQLEAVKVAIGVSTGPVVAGIEVAPVIPDSIYVIVKTNVITGRNGSFLQYVVRGDRGGLAKITKRDIDDSSVSVSKAKGLKAIRAKNGQVIRFKTFK